jgi:hypothetical protein
MTSREMIQVILPQMHAGRNGATRESGRVPAERTRRQKAARRIEAAYIHDADGHGHDLNRTQLRALAESSPAQRSASQLDTRPARRGDPVRVTE